MILSGPKGAFWLGRELARYYDIAESGRSHILVSLGTPIMNQTSVVGVLGESGLYATAENGFVAWSPRAGLRAVKSPIFGPGMDAGHLIGFIGFPIEGAVSAESHTDSTATKQRFQTGIVYATSKGSFPIANAFYDAYQPCLGLPTSASSMHGVFTDQDFEGGRIWAASGGPIHVECE
jgi:hypothetical protein